MPKEFCRGSILTHTLPAENHWKRVRLSGWKCAIPRNDGFDNFAEAIKYAVETLGRCASECGTCRWRGSIQWCVLNSLRWHKISIGWKLLRSAPWDRRSGKLDQPMKRIGEDSVSIPAKPSHLEAASDAGQASRRIRSNTTSSSSINTPPAERLDSYYYFSDRHALPALELQADGRRRKDGLIKHVMSGVNPQGRYVDATATEHG